MLKNSVAFKSIDAKKKASKLHKASLFNFFIPHVKKALYSFTSSIVVSSLFIIISTLLQGLQSIRGIARIFSTIEMINEWMGWSFHRAIASWIRKACCSESTGMHQWCLSTSIQRESSRSFINWRHANSHGIFHVKHQKNEDWAQ